MAAGPVPSGLDATVAVPRTVASSPWQWPALAAILLLTAALDFVNLSREGYGNTYYAAAVRSMLTSWHDFFFVSFDPGGFVSIDKPPLGFWIQVASAWLFGFSGWSLLFPEALAGILAVATLFLLVRRSFGPAAGLLAALALALTPITVATDRNNTIDGLLALVLLLAAAAFSSAAATGRLRWLVLGAAIVGLGFNVKMLEAFLPLPAFYLTYLIATPLRWRVRLVHLALGTSVLVVVSLSWATVVDLVPPSQRPYVGSSSDNSELNLIIGYNGIDRVAPGRFVFGRPTRDAAPVSRSAASTAATGPRASPGLGPPLQAIDQRGVAGGFGPFGNGQPGPLRLLDRQLAGQISWLVPLAAIGLIVTAPQVGTGGTSSPRQRALILWGTWFSTEAVFFSLAREFHPYYMVTLAPAIAALAGIGLVTLWSEYRDGHARWWVLPVAFAVTALVQTRILADYPTWAARLTLLVLGGAMLSTIVLVGWRLR